MSNVHFVRTRHHYDPYDDLFRLAELSGYSVIYIDEVDPQSDNCYIVTPVNGEWRHGWENPRARIVWWGFEWNTDGKHYCPPGCEAWHIDSWQAKTTGVRYVPVGSHPGLNPSPEEVAKKYDLAVLAYMPPRREQIAHDCREAGLSLSPYSVWGDDRHYVLSRSRAMLYVHQEDVIRGVAGLRWALAAAYRIPVISEDVNDWGILPQPLMMQYGQLATFAERMLHYCPELIEQHGQALHQALCQDHTFRKVVEAAL